MSREAMATDLLTHGLEGNLQMGGGRRSFQDEGTARARPGGLRAGVLRDPK